jgi:hypothetical protein
MHLNETVVGVEIWMNSKDHGDLSSIRSESEGWQWMRAAIWVWLPHWLTMAYNETVICNSL